MDQIDPNKLAEKAEKVSKLLKIMSHPSRLMNGERPVNALNEVIPLSQSALSQHLAGLRRAGLANTRRESRILHYRLKSMTISRILEALTCRFFLGLMVVSTCHTSTNRLTLPNCDHAVLYKQLQRKYSKNQKNMRGDIMAEEKVQDYTDDKNEGHVDTREKNFECDNKDEHLGCDPGIDVAG